MLKNLNSVLISGKEVLPLIEGGKGVAVSNGISSGSWAASGGVGTFSGVVEDPGDVAAGQRATQGGTSLLTADLTRKNGWVNQDGILACRAKILSRRLLAKSSGYPYPLFANSGVR